MSTVANEAYFAQRAAALAERAAGPRPTSWRPDRAELAHPNPIVGVLLRVLDGPDRGFGPTRIAELRDVDGREWAVWLLGQVLRSEFDQEAARAPRPGELVAIHYEGRRQGASAEYEAYRVVVDRAPPAEAAPSLCCDQCGHAEPEHAAGCPNELPF